MFNIKCSLSSPDSISFSIRLHDLEGDSEQQKLLTIISKIFEEFVIQYGTFLLTVYTNWTTVHGIESDKF